MLEQRIRQKVVHGANRIARIAGAEVPARLCRDAGRTDLQLDFGIGGQQLGCHLN